MTEHRGFLVFLERTPYWKDFLVTALHNMNEPSFSMPKILSITAFDDAADLFRQAPGSLLIAEIVPAELPQLISGVVRLKNHHHRARFAAYAPELMKMSPLEYDQTKELLFQAGFLAVITSFEELLLLRKSIIRHFEPLSGPKHDAEQTEANRIWNSLPWSENM